jgi:hypothetical protein
MRGFRARLNAVADLNEQLRELQHMASDLELSVLQECPVCYEVELPLPLSTCSTSQLTDRNSCVRCVCVCVCVCDAVLCACVCGAQCRLCLCHRRRPRRRA